MTFKNTVYVISYFDFHTNVCKVITGGFSNHLYGFYQDGKFDEDVVLVRVNGTGTEHMVDREAEKENLQVPSHINVNRCIMH